MGVKTDEYKTYYRDADGHTYLIRGGVLVGYPTNSDGTISMGKCVGDDDDEGCYVQDYCSEEKEIADVYLEVIPKLLELWESKTSGMTYFIMYHELYMMPTVTMNFDHKISVTNYTYDYGKDFLALVLKQLKNA